MAWPGPEPRTSRILLEHSDHWATEPNGRPVIISPCSFRFIHESARHDSRSDETVSPSTDLRWAIKCHRGGKAHVQIETRTQALSHTVLHVALWSLDYRATRSTCDIFFTEDQTYRNDPTFSDRYAWANSADRDQRGAVWSGSTLFAIPSASFGLITLW